MVSKVLIVRFSPTLERNSKKHMTECIAKFVKKEQRPRFLWLLLGSPAPSFPKGETWV